MESFGRFFAGVGEISGIEDFIKLEEGATLDSTPHPRD